MPRQDVNKMFHTPGKGSEWADYILMEFKTAITSLEKEIDKKINLSDLIQHDNSKVTENTNVIEQYSDIVEILNSISILAEKIDAIKDAITTLSSKLDNEDVTNLDTNYKQTITGILK